MMLTIKVTTVTAAIKSTGLKPRITSDKSRGLLIHAGRVQVNEMHPHIFWYFHDL